MKITIQLKWGEGSREVARWLAVERGVGKSWDWEGVGTEERNLKGGGAQQCHFALCAAGGYLRGNQQTEGLVVPSWQPAAPPELLPVRINVQEEPRARNPRSAWQTA